MKYIYDSSESTVPSIDARVIRSTTADTILGLAGAKLVNDQQVSLEHPEGVTDNDFARFARERVTAGRAFDRPNVARPAEDNRDLLKIPRRDILPLGDIRECNVRFA